MKRYLTNGLLEWKKHPQPLPLLLRGARQVGKTYLVETFGREHFENLVTVNFEFQPEFKSCFDTFNPQEITNTISLLINKPITPGKSLLFLDEIQECPNAIKSLRYFKELMPELHVIGAGSLLELSLSDEDFRMPVGRVMFMYLKPLSFKEFLVAVDNTDLCEFIEKINLRDKIPEPIHQKLLKLIREYMVLGGMPAVVQEYLNSQNFSQCQIIQSALLNAYRSDFGKYASRTDHKYLQQLFERIPGLIAQHFKFSKVDPDVRARDLKKALQKLRDAGLIYQIFATAACGLPLNALMDEKRFKLLFLDIGLVNRAARLDADILLQQDLLLVNRGIVAEQLVGQELLAYSNYHEPGQLFFWTREKHGSTAEIDFVVNVDSTIVPIEVKSGSTGRLKSLRMFMEEKQSKIGVQISQQPLNFDHSILSVPLYLMGEIFRLVTEV